MTAELAPAQDARQVAEIVAEWLQRGAPTTRRGYSYDLSIFQRHVGAATLGDAVAYLVAGGAVGANRVAMAWLAAMHKEKLAPATRQRRLCALRSLVRFLRRTGVVVWSLDVDSVRVKARRDVSGMPHAAFLELLAASSTRDRAIFDLMGGRGLRASEVVGIGVGDVYPSAWRIWIVGKGSDGQREPLSVAPRTAGLLAAWLAERGPEEGSLFGIASYERLYELCKARGFAPHSLRHVAGTRAAAMTNGDPFKIAAFLRHADIRTAMAYVDAWRNSAGATADLVAQDEIVESL